MTSAITNYQPLQSEIPFIAQFVNRQILGNERPEESKISYIARTALRGLGIFLSFGGRVPYIEVNLEIAGNNLPYGIILAAATVISFGFLVAGSTEYLIHQFLSPTTLVEAKLKESKLSRRKKISFIIVALIAGFVTQVPFALLAYEYNKESSINPKKILAPVMIYLIDTWVFVESAYKALEGFDARQAMGEKDTALWKVKNALTQKLRINKALWNQYSLTNNTPSLQGAMLNGSTASLLDEYKSLSTEQDPKKTFQKASEFFFKQKELPQKLFLEKRWDSFVYYFGVVCGMSNTAFLAYISYLGPRVVKSLNSEEALSLGLFFALVYIGVSCTLNFSFIPTGASSINTLFKDVLSRKYKPTISDQTLPKVSIITKTSLVVCAIFSYGLSQKIVKDYNILSLVGLPPQNAFMNSLMTPSAVFLVFMPIILLSDSWLLSLAAQAGGKDVKKMANFLGKVELFEETLSMCSPLEIGKMLNYLPEKTKKTLLASCHLDEKEQTMLLEKKEEPPQYEEV